MGKVGYGLRSPGWRLDLRQPTRMERRLLARKSKVFPKSPKSESIKISRFYKWFSSLFK